MTRHIRSQPLGERRKIFLELAVYVFNIILPFLVCFSILNLIHKPEGIVL